MIKAGFRWFARAGALPVVALSLVLLSGAQAFAAPFPPQTSSGSVGIQGTISTAPPTRGATIATPGNGANFTTLPVTVTGLCPTGLLVKIFANNVFVGSTYCQSGSYSVQVDLFSGQNTLVARVYDALDQAGPDSNTVTVTYTDAQFLQFGTHVQVSSDTAERGSPPNQELDWPFLISGGTGPYAISIDWGDGSASDLSSQQNPGTFTGKHTYRSAGIYYVIVQVTDKNGGKAYLQVVAVATGSTQTNNKASGSNNTASVEVEVLWWPALAMLPLIFAAFWIGRRYELYVLRKQLEKSRDTES